MVIESVDGAHRLLHAPLAGGLLVADREFPSLTRCFMPVSKISFESGVAGVGGDYGEGNGVAAIGVVELHVARQACLYKAWMRETTLWVSASVTMAGGACCACRRTGAPPDALIRTKALAAKLTWGERRWWWRRARRRDEVQDRWDAVSQGRKQLGEVVGCVHVGREESAIRMRLPRSITQPPRRQRNAD